MTRKWQFTVPMQSVWMSRIWFLLTAKMKRYNELRCEKMSSVYQKPTPSPTNAFRYWFEKYRRVVSTLNELNTTRSQVWNKLQVQAKGRDFVVLKPVLKWRFRFLDDDVLLLRFSTSSSERNSVEFFKVHALPNLRAQKDGLDGLSDLVDYIPQVDVEIEQMLREDFNIEMTTIQRVQYRNYVRLQFQRAVLALAQRFNQDAVLDLDGWVFNFDYGLVTVTHYCRSWYNNDKPVLCVNTWEDFDKV